MFTKQLKMHQETHRNFLGIFFKKTKVHRGSRKLKRNRKKPKAHGYRAQTHAARWIRISRMPQRRWINPDPPIPRSTGQERRKAGSGLNRPGPTPIQKKNGPVHSHFLPPFLFLLHLLRSSLYFLR